MWNEPDDAAVTARMRAAHHHARTALHVQSEHHCREAWGWQGRTLGQPVTTDTGPGWLRLACIPTDQVDRTFFDGAIHAESAIPRSVPRPRLRGCHDWADPPWAYRAELYDRAPTPPVSPTPNPTTTPDLPPTWWASIRKALDDIATITTDRLTAYQGYLNYAMPRFLGAPITTTAPSWTTAHGDFHYANLCAPTLHILDWEGWGLAPTGYDAATLHAHSLALPALAARVRHELGHLLDTPAGTFAELAVITELLDRTTRGDYLELAQPLRHRAMHLLRRPVPLLVAAPATRVPATGHVTKID